MYRFKPGDIIIHKLEPKAVFLVQEICYNDNLGTNCYKLKKLFNNKKFANVPDPYEDNCEAIDFVYKLGA